MAKKAKQPKLTEEDKERLEQCFQQVRDQSLRQWYTDSHCEDPQVRAAAQARLQLQFWLRDKRKEIGIYKQERDAYKTNGDTNGLATARKKLKKAQFAMVMHAKMAVEGIPASTEAKACRKWAKTTYTLQEILDDRDLDKRTEFGINRDSLSEYTAHGVGNDDESAEGSSVDFMEGAGGIKLEDQSAETTPEWRSVEEDSIDPSPNPINIWSQHALHMQERYRQSNLPDHVIETKLAFQKKLFDQHVDRDTQLRNATQYTLNLNPNDAHIRQGISTSWNPVLVTTTFSEHSLWELTSPLLWRYFEGAKHWDMSKWVPSGIMRIQTVSNSTYIYLEFGLRTLSTQRVEVPATISRETWTVSARCYESGEDVDVSITFLDQGFVRVCIPVNIIMQSAVGLVELTGVWLGPVE
jgi:hypothetical protein